MRKAVLAIWMIMVVFGRLTGQSPVRIQVPVFYDFSHTGYVYAFQAGTGLRWNNHELNIIYKYQPRRGKGMEGAYRFYWASRFPSRMEPMVSMGFAFFREEEPGLIGIDYSESRYAYAALGMRFFIFHNLSAHMQFGLCYQSVQWGQRRTFGIRDNNRWGFQYDIPVRDSWGAGHKRPMIKAEDAIKKNTFILSFGQPILGYYQPPWSSFYALSYGRKLSDNLQPFIGLDLWQRDSLRTFPVIPGAQGTTFLGVRGGVRIYPFPDHFFHPYLEGSWGRTTTKHFDGTRLNMDSFRFGSGLQYFIYPGIGLDAGFSYSLDLEYIPHGTGYQHGGFHVGIVGEF